MTADELATLRAAVERMSRVQSGEHSFKVYGYDHTYDSDLMAFADAVPALLDAIAAKDAAIERLRAAIFEYSIYAEARGSAPFGATEKERAALQPKDVTP